MMKLEILYNLPFISIEVSYKGASINISNILIDTGSASTILAADSVKEIGIQPDDNDIPYSIRGVGGSEIVYRRCIDYIKADALSIENFDVEIGGMDYGFDINGIVGMDFLVQSNAIIDLHQMLLNLKSE
ncbi:hypothetical protein MHK_003605 [Candidatus Magnetomorum sp. HK-1]|nr:hypothetical protein MHK_003605 [Candidatus Magnetomorum sp. HK-1]